MSALSLAKAGIEIGGRNLVGEVDLTLEPGRFTVLVGPNGSGKSTILRLLCGLWKPTEGHVELDGQNLDRFGSREIARRVTLVRQSAQLRYSFTVREVVAMGRFPHERNRTKVRTSHDPAVEEAMRRTDVTGLADRYANRLSGGELQRVFLARCLATEAEYILLDEPTANLDLSHSLDVLGMCRDLAREGRAVVVAIHDLSAAVRFADDAAVLSEGRLINSGAAKEVLDPGLIERVFRVHAERVEAESGATGFLFSA